MRSSYNQRKAKALSDLMRARAHARWGRERKRREAGIPGAMRELAETEAMNFPRKPGDAIGCLQWTDFRTGKVRRWVIRIGDRIDRVTLEVPGGKQTGSHGWTWIMDHLRGYLSGHKQLSPTRE